MDNVRSSADRPATFESSETQASVKAASEGSALESGETQVRRTYNRYPLSADAVMIEPRSRTRLRGRAADLSLGGCYVDAINLFPVGTVVGLRLTTEGHSFECEARVTYFLRGMGMGLAFVRAAPDQASALRGWIAELSGEPDPKAPPAPQVSFDDSRQGAVENNENSQSALAELVNLLQRKGVLAESEAAGLRNKLAR